MPKRLFENLDVWFPLPEDCEGEYQFPMMKAQPLPDAKEWIAFSEAKGDSENHTKAVHMFVDDYRMTRLWRFPQRYLTLLRSYACVLSPDFSMYTDEPKALQIMNAYRRQWLGAWWQNNGLTVIPTVCWADESSFTWCFHGIPHHATVAISTVGTQKHRESKKLFDLGCAAMVKHLHPHTVLVFGDGACDIDANIIRIPARVAGMRKAAQVG